MTAYREMRFNVRQAAAEQDGLWRYTGEAFDRAMAKFACPTTGLNTCPKLSDGRAVAREVTREIREKYGIGIASLWAWFQIARMVWFVVRTILEQLRAKPHEASAVFSACRAMSKSGD
jgi:hypothetical protein